MQVRRGARILAGRRRWHASARAQRFCRGARLVGSAASVRCAAARPPLRMNRAAVAVAAPSVSNALRVRASIAAPCAGTPMAKLYFYYSAMNAGKTTTLLQSAHNYHERGMRTLILTPALDQRYGEGIVASRIGLQARAMRFSGDDDIFAIVERDIERRGPLNCVLVDEAQFMSKAQVWQLSDVV